LTAAGGQCQFAGKKPELQASESRSRLLADLSTLNGWMVLGGIALATFYFVAPLMVLSSFRAQASATVEELPEETLLPPQVQDRIDQVDDALMPAGFQCLGRYFLQRHVSNVRTLIVLYVNRATQEGAMAVTMYSQVNNNWRQSHFLDLFTRWQNGQEIDTLNSPIVPVFQGRPYATSCYLPWVSDPGELYRIHKAITPAKGPSGPRELKLDGVYHGDVIAYIIGVLREGNEGGRKIGYLRLTEDGTQYRATLKGAYLMAWKSLFPVKGWLARRRDRKTRNLLAELGIA
jgi:hypothetical protein